MGDGMKKLIIRRTSKKLMDWVLSINNNNSGDFIILLAKVHLDNIFKIYVGKEESFNKNVEKKVIQLLNANLAMMDNLYLIGDKIRINDTMPTVAKRINKTIDEDTYDTLMVGLSKVDNLLLSNYRSLMVLKN
jgi:hypothetical protein